MATIHDGMIRGPVRHPVNAHQQAANSIHNDEVAGSLGFRGGTVAGSVHMDQFPPVLMEAFGRRWFETGSLSLRFRHATISGEPVVAVVGAPEGPVLPTTAADLQVPARMEDGDGVLVAEGTAAVGRPDEPTFLHALDLRPSDPSELRMFGQLHPGDPIISAEEQVASADAVARHADGRITEPLDWYTGASPWGGPIASPSSVVRLLWARSSARLTKLTGGAVGLFGAIEVRHIAGPVLADTTYQVDSCVAAAGTSPKTEYVWFDSAASDDEGRLVASMRMQLRWMKASSSAYA